MEKQIFRIIRIEGEYAYLQSVDKPIDEPLFIAMALLPAGSDIGSVLEYESFVFTLK